MFVFHAVSPRPGLVKLLALSNFQAHRRSLRDSRFTGHLGQFLFIVDTSVIGASTHRMRALVTGISNPMTALRRFLLLLVHVDDLTPEWPSRFDSLDRGG